MRNLKLIALGLMLVAATSCEKGEDEPSITLDDLVGSWKATSAVLSNKANMSETVDLIALGGELRFTMLDGGGVRTWFTIDTISDEWDAQAVLSNDMLTLTPVEAERGVDSYEFVLENNSLILTNNDDSFDFTLSGGPEVPAKSVANFVRQ